MKLESQFQADLMDELHEIFPEAIIMKTDPNYIQGLPDILILNGDRWASLECKRSEDAPRRPNQEYYVNKMNQMSYSNFVYPENREEILDELQQSLRPNRKARLSRR